LRGNWQLLLTRRIARSLGDSWASCIAKLEHLLLRTGLWIARNLLWNFYDVKPLIYRICFGFCSQGLINQAQQTHTHAHTWSNLGLICKSIYNFVCNLYDFIPTMPPVLSCIAACTARCRLFLCVSCISVSVCWPLLWAIQNWPRHSCVPKETWIRWHVHIGFTWQIQWIDLYSSGHAGCYYQHCSNLFGLHLVSLVHIFRCRRILIVNWICMPSLVGFLVLFLFFTAKYKSIQNWK